MSRCGNGSSPSARTATGSNTSSRPGCPETPQRPPDGAAQAPTAMSRFLVLRHWEKLAILRRRPFSPCSPSMLPVPWACDPFDARPRLVQPRDRRRRCGWPFRVGLASSGSRLRCSPLAGRSRGPASWHWWPLVLAVGSFAPSSSRPRPQAPDRARRSGGAGRTDRISGLLPSGHTATSAVCFGVICLSAPVCQHPCAIGVRLEGRSERGDGGRSHHGLAAVLGDFHWVADGLGGLVLAFVVLLVPSPPAAPTSRAGSPWHLSECRRSVDRE